MLGAPEIEISEMTLHSARSSFMLHSALMNKTHRIPDSYSYPTADTTTRDTTQARHDATQQDTGLSLSEIVATSAQAVWNRLNGIVST